jgi:hypothetical protein
MADLRCAWCGDVFEKTNRRGPIPRYCTAVCRQRAYEHRRLQQYRSIVRDLAARERPSNGYHCFLCGASGTRLEVPASHMETCPWRRAREIVNSRR